MLLSYSITIFPSFDKNSTEICLLKVHVTVYVVLIIFGFFFQMKTQSRHLQSLCELTSAMI